MGRYRTYLLTAVVAFAITCVCFLAETFVSPIQLINLKGRDLYFKLRHDFFPLPEDAKKIVLITLDDETLQYLDTRWPYPRTFYARALEQLKQFKPTAVGFDLVFSGKDFIPESDQVFGASLKAIGNAVIAIHVTKEGEVGPPPVLTESAWRVGMVDKPRDQDQTIRRAYVTRNVQGKEIRSWELDLFEKAFPNVDIEKFPLEKAVSINYRVKFNEFQRIPFWKLMENTDLEKEIRGKIVLIGLTSEAFHDVHDTPMGSMRGLAVNANWLMTLMTRSFFSQAPFWNRAALSFLSIWLILLVSLTGTVLNGFFILLCLILTFLSSSFFLFVHQVILDPWLFSVAMIMTMVGAVAFREWQLFFENLRLREESSRDPLTGFYSRRFLELKLKVELGKLVTKHGGPHAVKDVSVVMIDLDNFKLVNDSFGHNEGDRVLKTMAESIRSSVRKEELICRFGGDEFCVILVNTPIEGASKFAEKLRNIIDKNPNLSYRTADGTNTVRVTGSIGVASVTGAKATAPEKLMKAADRALYRAKAGGRNQVCIYDSARDVIE